jgi:hypothetical protein
MWGLFWATGIELQIALIDYLSRFFQDLACGFLAAIGGRGGFYI